MACVRTYSYKLVFNAYTPRKQSLYKPYISKRGSLHKWCASGEDHKLDASTDAAKQRRERTNDTPDTARYDEGATKLPMIANGVNWYCYTVLGLLFLVDFTPLGQLIQSQASSGLWLCVLQWGLCVVPTLAYSKQQDWDLIQTFKLNPASPSSLAIGALAGPAVWAAVALAISLKTGVPLNHPFDPSTAAPSAMSQLFTSPSSASEWTALLGTAALSPAVAEELLFRGFLLTSLQQRFGRVDAFMLAAALFAAIHLSPEQFFPFCVLGIACGAVATAANSVLPAMALHLTHNAAALVAGVLLNGGS